MTTKTTVVTDDSGGQWTVFLRGDKRWQITSVEVPTYGFAMTEAAIMQSASDVMRAVRRAVLDGCPGCTALPDECHQEGCPAEPTWTVQCADGEVRHRPFASRAEAWQWAEWGHCCTSIHRIERTPVAS